MKHKTADLEGALLDAAAMKAAGHSCTARLTPEEGDFQFAPDVLVDRSAWIKGLRAYVSSKLGDEVELP